MSPPFLMIPAGMLKPITALNDECTLSVLPNEVIFKIINDNILTVFDRACFMLTSKGAAHMVESSHANLSIPTIAHGMEDEALEIEFEDHEECSECGYWLDELEGEPECGCEGRLQELRNAVAERTPEHRLVEFFERLDKGWNLSETRFCSGCGLFKSTDVDHWLRKAEAIQYKRCGQLAKFWRAGRYEYPYSIEYGQDANEYVKVWIAGTANGSLKCPECKVIEWSSRCMECEY